MALNKATGDFVTTVISTGSQLAAAGTTMTIGTGLTIPATNGVLQIDYDSSEALGAASGPETISYASYTSGTGAITGMTRGLAGTTGVTHENGASVQCAPSAAYGGNGVTLMTDITNPYKMRAYPSADQTGVADATWTTVTLGTEVYDINSNFASSTYTAPVTGYYLINANLQIQGTAIVVSGVRLLKNGTDIPTTASNTFTAGSSATGVSLSMSDILKLTAGDTLVMQGYADATGTVTFEGSSEAYTNLAIHLLSL